MRSIKRVSHPVCRLEGRWSLAASVPTPQSRTEDTHTSAKNDTVRLVRARETHLLRVFISPFCRSVWIWLSAAASGSDSRLAAPHRSSAPLRHSAAPAFYKLRHTPHSVSVRAQAAVSFLNCLVQFKPHSFGCSSRFTPLFQHRQPPLTALLYPSLSAWQTFLINPVLVTG